MGPLRECMFGGVRLARCKARIGTSSTSRIRSTQTVAQIAGVARRNIALRRGRQYLREISGDGVSFGLPRMIGGQMRSVVAWSASSTTAKCCSPSTPIPISPVPYVTIDGSLHTAGERLRCTYATDSSLAGGTLAVESRNGKAVLLTVPPAGFVVYE